MASIAELSILGNTLVVLGSTGLIVSGMCLSLGSIYKPIDNKKVGFLFCTGMTSSFIGALILYHKSTLFRGVMGVELTKMLYT